MLKPTEQFDAALCIAYKQGWLKGFFGDMYQPELTITQLEIIHALQKKGRFYIASKMTKRWLGMKNADLDLTELKRTLKV